MTSKPLWPGVLLVGTTMVLLPPAIAQQSNHERFDRQIGSETSVSVPGSAGDQELTKKQWDPFRDQQADHNAQITVGGARPIVSGQIGAIQGHYYFIKDEESGEEIRLLVNGDTNLDCSIASAGTKSSSAQDVVVTDRQPNDIQASRSSERQKEQGQREDETAVGSGFRIGTCAFEPGNRIKAEVDDMGRATTMRLMDDRDMSTAQRSRSLGEGAGTGELAIPGKQDKPGQLDMTGVQGYPPKQYSILPVPIGALEDANENLFLRSPVKNLDGTVIGSLERLMIDSHRGQIEYAVISLHSSNQIAVVPWIHMKIVSPDEGQPVLIVDTRQFQLFPNVTLQQSVDQSPAMEKVIKNVKGAEAPIDLRNADLPTVGAQAASQHKLSSEPTRLCVSGNCQVVRGRVMKVQDEIVFLKDRSGKEVRTVVDRKTHRGQMGMRDEPYVGDWIEAYVTPKGHAESISLLRTGADTWNEGDG